MNEGLYIAASGGTKQLKKLDLIGNNVANAVTQGFKRDLLLYNSVLPAQNHQGIGGLGPAALDMPVGGPSTVAYVEVVRSMTDFSQGSLISTENPFDVALEGEGFFVLDTPLGERYTRNGSFSLDADGQLVDPLGNLVVNLTGAKRNSENEPIFIPSGIKEITIDQEGLVYGELDNELVVFGQVKVVNFRNKNDLLKEGNGIFKNSNPRNVPEIWDEVKVLQGYKETSNVNALQEMTQMIETVRTLEAYQKIIQSIDEADEQSVNNLARVA